MSRAQALASARDLQWRENRNGATRSEGLHRHLPFRPATKCRRLCAGLESLSRSRLLGMELGANPEFGAVKEIFCRHCALSGGLDFGDAKPCRSSAGDSEIVFRQFRDGSGPKLSLSRFGRNVDKLDSLIIKKAVAAGKGRETPQAIENL